MINTDKLELHIKAAITTKKSRLMLLVLLGPLRDAVACALEKFGGTANSQKLEGRSVCEKKGLHINENSNVLLLYRGIIVFSP
jgi:hypothetical protein